MSAMIPSLSVIVKLGSLAVHIDEYLSPDGVPEDRAAINTLLQDEELKTWIEEQTKTGFLPVKRNAR